MLAEVLGWLLDHFYKLEKSFPNFKFYISLSEPLPEDNWKIKKDINSEGDGFVGFIHNCVIENYLNYHESPEDIELYFCGPPLMNQAAQKMGEDFEICKACNIKQELECPICTEVFRGKHLASFECHHRVCCQCYCRSFLINKPLKKCPLCRKDIKK